MRTYVKKKKKKIKDVTRAVYKTTADGKRVRVCKKTGDEI